MQHFFSLGFLFGALLGGASIYMRFPHVSIAQAIAVDLMLIAFVLWVHSYRRSTWFILRLGGYAVALALGILYLFVPLR